MLLIFIMLQPYLCHNVSRGLIWNRSERMHKKPCKFIAQVTWGRALVIQYDGFTQKIVLIRSFLVTLWKTLHAYCSGLPQYRAFEETVLLRKCSWKSHYLETRRSPCTLTVHVPCDTELWWVDMVVLLKRWSWKGHLSATVGKTVLCMFTV